MATLELNSSVARPRKHGEVVLRRCSAKRHATTIKWSLHLPPRRCSAGVGLERGSWRLLSPAMGRSSSAEPHGQLKKTFEINKGVAFIARRLYPPLLGSIACAQRVLLAMLLAGGGTWKLACVIVQPNRHGKAELIHCSAIPHTILKQFRWSQILSHQFSQQTRNLCVLCVNA